MSQQQTQTNPISDEQNIAVGLDLGTSKVCVIVASQSLTTKAINILGIGVAESYGMKRGVISNIDKTIQAIQKAVEQAEQQSGIKIKEVVVGIAGDHIESYQTRGIVGISNPNEEITKEDVERVLDECRNSNLPLERKILHIIPQEFIIDKQDGIYDPVGMSGVRMEAITHIVTGSSSAVRNIYKCIERLGITIKDVILEPIASSYSVLFEDEKELGVALIDIGGGTTDITIFEENIIRFTKVIALGGMLVTSDIRSVVAIPDVQAERIKIEYGHCYSPNLIDDEESFMIPGISGRKPKELKTKELCQIIQPRMEEIFQFALSEIRNSGYSGRLGAGVVLTGGCSLLRGAEDLAEEVFGMPIKMGIPSISSYSGLAREVNNPCFSTAVGLALHSLKLEENIEVIENEEKITKKVKKDSIFNKFKNYIKDL